jgi:hypothetical protein
VPPFPFLQPDADIRIPDAGSNEEISPAQGRTKAVPAGERLRRDVEFDGGSTFQLQVVREVSPCMKKSQK